MAANPRFEENLHRRAAAACRNIQKQAAGKTAWFDWVPRYLDRLADAEAPRDGRTQPEEQDR